MQLRCQKCHKPFALSRDATHAALDTMASENLSHYDALCPHCKRINRISPAELQRGAPDWPPPETDQGE